MRERVGPWLRERHRYRDRYDAWRARRPWRWLRDVLPAAVLAQVYRAYVFVQGRVNRARG